MGKGKRTKARGIKVPVGVTPAQFNAIKSEINRQILEADKKYSVDFASAVLWALHVEFGFGAGRLRRMWNSYANLHGELRRHYEATEEEVPFICRQLLKNIGVDVEQWDREETNERKQ